MILPNVIIAGAPKCGSTSLFVYLSHHPEVCASNTKETRYMIDKGYPLYHDENNYQENGLDGYGIFYPHYNPRRHKIILEATPDYLYQKTPLKALPAFDQRTHVFFILRRPSERIYSLFRFAQNNMAVLNRDITFKQFLGMLKKNETFDHDLILSNAIEHSKYVNYLRYWYDVLESRYIHIFLFEDMITNTLGFMNRISNILGISQGFYEKFDFRTENETVVIRNVMLHKLQRRLKKKLSFFMHHGRLKNLLKGSYEWFNVKKIQNQINAEDLKLLSQLDHFFIPYNEKLQAMTGLGIDKWWYGQN